MSLDDHYKKANKEYLKYGDIDYKAEGMAEAHISNEEVSQDKSAFYYNIKKIYHFAIEYKPL
jgi:hypothetical protein